MTDGKTQHLVVSFELGEMDHWDAARTLQQVIAGLTRFPAEDAYKTAFPIAGGNIIERGNYNSPDVDRKIGTWGIEYR